MASRGENRLALNYIRRTKAAFGPLSRYTFGIELELLEIFVRGCLNGIKADDYDWILLKHQIMAAREYNSSEKLHLLLYLEELATTAGASLPLADGIDALSATEPVSPALRRRFPKLSETAS